MPTPKFTFFVILILFYSNSLFSQVEQDSIQKKIEVMPQFPGGDEELFKFLSSNIRYPGDARENGEQGTVYVTFVVEKDGSISDVSILRGVSPSLDKESIRVIGAMPDWKPGTQDNIPVRVQCNLPIRFALKGNDTSKKKKKKKR